MAEAPGRKLRAYSSHIPVESADVTLVDKDNDTFAITLQEKVSMLRAAEGGQLVGVWRGKFESHGFEIDPDRALTDIIERAQQGRSAR